MEASNFASTVSFAACESLSKLAGILIRNRSLRGCLVRVQVMAHVLAVDKTHQLLRLHSHLDERRVLLV
jgi:hypothetical protein